MIEFIAKEKTLLWATIFAVALAFIETAVVVYLRGIYYPGGFEFPLQHIDLDIAIIEIIREAGTLIVLLSIGWLAGENFISRFAYFIYSFAVWDIYYYVFLKLTLGWPESLLTWDILFLIPVTWVGPVISPVIVSFTMILLATAIIYYNKHVPKLTFKNTEWALLITGSLVLVVGFCWDYSSYLLEEYFIADIFNISGNKAFLAYLSNYIPESFNWFLFVLGELIIISGIILFIKRIKMVLKK